MSNAELLAILIGSGSTNESAVELMRRLLADCDNRLKTLGRLSLNDLVAYVETLESHTGKKKRERRYKGLGEAKAITILAACELGRRRMTEDAQELPRISSSVDLYNYYLPKTQDLAHEECYALLMNQSCKILDNILISKGGITEAAVDIRIIIREALLHGATVVALCHNHPSGNEKPSMEDNRLTERLHKACKMMNIHLLDHIIITDGNFYSYREEGQLF